jgi:ribosomal-protein-alanine N-acetyltransferase
MQAMTIRPATAADSAAIARIQAASPGASQWMPEGYMVEVAVEDDHVAGFVVTRAVGPGEFEVLNVAVDALYQRRGVARQLLRHALTARPGQYWLEVRESHESARKLYETLGFHVAGRRPSYYDNPQEAAIVMRLQS